MRAPGQGADGGHIVDAVYEVVRLGVGPRHFVGLAVKDELDGLGSLIIGIGIGDAEVEDVGWGAVLRCDFIVPDFGRVVPVRVVALDIGALDAAR